jgi:hypothetical protein
MVYNSTKADRFTIINATRADGLLCTLGVYDIKAYSALIQLGRLLWPLGLFTLDLWFVEPAVQATMRAICTHW